MGPEVVALETAMRRLTGWRYAIALSSGTAALDVGLALLDLQPGDEVIVPAVSFVATAFSVVRSGATPVFADVEAAQSPTISARAIENCLTRRTKAIITMDY